MSELDELFPPRPGGLVDSARKQAAAATPADEPGEDFDGSRYNPVKVQVRVPEIASAGTVVVSTGGTAVQRIIGTDGERARTILTALDEDVVITFSRVAADDPRNAETAAGKSAGGYVLAAGAQITLDTVSEIFVTATSATAGRVSFIRQSYSA